MQQVASSDDAVVAKWRLNRLGMLGSAAESAVLSAHQVPHLVQKDRCAAETPYGSEIVCL